MSSGPSFDESRRALGEGPSAARRGLQRARLLRGIERSRKPLLGFAAVVAAVLAAVVWWPRASEPVRDAQGPVALGRVEAAEASRSLSFSEGSEVTLQSGTAISLDVLDDARVEIRLERGHLDAHVMKGTARTWRYHAGPWTVRVVGTRLSINWLPEREVIDVSVSEGVVEVSGATGTPVLVRAGQSLQRSPPQREVVVMPAAPAQVVEEVKLPSSPPRRPLAPQPVVTAPVVVEEVVPPSWQQLLARGKRAEALETASARGVFAEALADADALLLADAARLERRGDLSRVLLAGVLERNGPNAAEAAFLLGRLELDDHRAEAGRRFFSRSVALAPEGAFAEQARGRLLETLLELQDLPAAREAARDYLAHHPGGAWEGVAAPLARSEPR